MFELIALMALSAVLVVIGNGLRDRAVGARLVAAGIVVTVLIFVLIAVGVVWAIVAISND